MAPGLKVHVLKSGAAFRYFCNMAIRPRGRCIAKWPGNLPPDRVRLIMPTLVGLGFSSKIPASAHLLDDHIGWINTVFRRYESRNWFSSVKIGAARSAGALPPLRPAGRRGRAQYQFQCAAGKMDLSRIHALVKTPIVGEMLTEVLNSIFDGLPRGQVTRPPCRLR